MELHESVVVGATSLVALLSCKGGLIIEYNPKVLTFSFAIQADFYGARRSYQGSFYPTPNLVSA